MFWCITFDDLFTYDLFFLTVIGESKQKLKYTREPQLSGNSGAARKKAKQYVVHRMIMTYLESKTRGGVYGNVKKIMYNAISVSQWMI